MLSDRGKPKGSEKEGVENTIGMCLRKWQGSGCECSDRKSNEIGNEIKNETGRSEVPRTWLKDWLRVNMGENLAHAMKRKCVLLPKSGNLSSRPVLQWGFDYVPANLHRPLLAFDKSAVTLSMIN